MCEQYLTYPTGALVQEGYAEALLISLKPLGENFDNQDDAWRANLMWCANQALNGLIGSGVPQDWATHMIGHELTALYGVDHARSLAIIQPSLLRNQLANKKAKLEQMGCNVFGLADGDDLAEQTIKHIESFYQSLNVPTQLTEHESEKSVAIDRIILQLEQNGMTKIGIEGAVTIDESRRILESAVA